MKKKRPNMSYADSSFKHFRGSLLKSFISRSHLKVSCGAIAFFLFLCFFLICMEPKEKGRLFSRLLVESPGGDKSVERKTKNAEELKSEKKKNGKYYYAVVCHFSGKKRNDFGAPFDHYHAIINGGMRLYWQKCHIFHFRGYTLTTA